MTTFVIRGYHWGYNDEVFFPEGTYIHSQYQSESEAQTAWKKLELSHWADMNAFETDAFFDSRDEDYEKLLAFYKEKTGKTFDESGWDQLYITKAFSEADALEFLKLAELQAYKITKFDEEPFFYTVYLPKEECYLTVHTEGPEILLYGATIDELAQLACDHLDYALGNDEGDIEIKGEIAKLTESPNILESTLKQLDIEYDNDKKMIFIPAEKIEAIFPINDLLKQQFFEVRKSTLEEIREIESNLEDY